MFDETHTKIKRREAVAQVDRDFVKKSTVYAVRSFISQEKLDFSTQNNYVILLKNSIPTTIVANASIPTRIHLTESVPENTRYHKRKDRRVLG